MLLAGINIAGLRYPKGDPRAVEFFDNLECANADASRGLSETGRGAGEFGRSETAAAEVWREQRCA
jgi:hypothetical protein